MIMMEILHTDRKCQSVPLYKYRSESSQNQIRGIDSVDCNQVQKHN